MQKTMTSREQIIGLVNQINDARAQLQRLEAELDQLLPPARGGRRLGKAKRAPRGSLARRVMHLLESEPTQVFRMADVARRLDASNLDSLRKTVLRLEAQRKIRRRRRGVYGAAKRHSATPRRQKRLIRSRRLVRRAG